MKMYWPVSQLTPPDPLIIIIIPIEQCLQLANIEIIASEAISGGVNLYQVIPCMPEYCSISACSFMVNFLSSIGFGLV